MKERWQKLTETAKAWLTARQEAAYDDQLRVKLAKSLQCVRNVTARQYPKD